MTCECGNQLDMPSVDPDYCSTCINERSTKDLRENPFLGYAERFVDAVIAVLAAGAHLTSTDRCDALGPVAAAKRAQIHAHDLPEETR